MTLHDVADTDQLTHALHALYPAMENTKYAIAVEKQIIAGNTVLANNDTVAILSPFSGG